MAVVNDSVLDAGLEEIRTAERVLICTAEPATYAAAIADILVENDAPTHGAIEDYTGGRQFTTEAVTGKTASATGTGAYYAYVDDTNSELLATQSLSATVSITSGESYNIGAITIQNPDVA